MNTSRPAIDPKVLYCFAETAALLPRSRNGRKVSLDTRHRLRRRGRLACTLAHAPRYEWKMSGAELLRLATDRRP